MPTENFTDCPNCGSQRVPPPEYEGGPQFCDDCGQGFLMIGGDVCPYVDAES